MKKEDEKDKEYKKCSTCKTLTHCTVCGSIHRTLEQRFRCL